MADEEEDFFEIGFRDALQLKPRRYYANIFHRDEYNTGYVDAIDTITQRVSEIPSAGGVSGIYIDYPLYKKIYREKFINNRGVKNLKKYKNGYLKASLGVVGIPQQFANDEYYLKGRADGFKQYELALDDEDPFIGHTREYLQVAARNPDRAYLEGGRKRRRTKKNNKRYLVFGRGNPRSVSSRA